MNRAIDGLRADQDALRLTLERLTLPSANSGALSVEDLEAAVDRAIERRGATLSLATVPAAELAPSAGLALSEAPDLDAVLEQLRDDELDQDAKQALWNSLREAGLLDEAVAVLEALAKARPHDPEAQVDYAEVCIQKIFEVGGGIQAGPWAMRADQAYDVALAADPEHWEARFSKAISLSFWPPITGKQAVAIDNFRTLIEQQERRSRRPEYAQTYLMLGNLYLQQGQHEQARQTFQAGLKQFPEDSELSEKIGS
ncbi:MAG: tetratricopeptide repeat protein [Planctomycetota bacterium]